MEKRHTHPLNLRQLPVTKSKDELFVRWIPARSQQRTTEEGFDVQCYDVLNMTQRTASEVEFFTVNGQRFGTCNCIAHVICKHITKAVLLHVARRRMQQAIATTPAPVKSDEQFWQDFARQS